MKRIFLFMAGLGLLAQVSFAQRIPESEVPITCQQAFHKLYPQVKNFFWEKEGKNFEANWKENHFDHSAVFTPEGHFVSSETDIPISNLPEAARQYARAHHLTIREASVDTDAQGTKTYEADIAHGKALIFDATGQYLKTVAGD